jgi:hypothetical protein
MTTENPVAWMLASALDDLQMDQFVEVTKKQEEQDDVPLYLHPAAPAPDALTAEQILGAVARGWCHPRNKFKVMDPDLAIAIAAEVSAMIAAAHVPEDDMADDGGCPVCGADGGTSCGMPNCGLLSAAPVPAVQSAARAIADEQSYDTGLWFVAETATEAHLQAALRRLTAAVEGETP